MSRKRGLEGKRERGFTLVELLVVIAIIGLLASIVGINVVKSLKKARQVKAKAQIRIIADAVKMFKIDNARFPDSLEDLVAQPASAMNWDGPYLDENVVPPDPWGGPYNYTLDSYDSFTVTSYGADGQQGGDGEGQDISNHDAALGQQQ